MRSVIRKMKKLRGAKARIEAGTASAKDWRDWERLSKRFA